ncbi:hypothetical protein PR202_gb11991 [Eleusine coracana subsp. coracana]|uniref:Sister chromatid cohesion protein n=1 Tax=Eleusine coracana subsp. coracana TaxID=191504 RepID=A0AAV5ENK2_ELECO|nr:hypothetical protein PR202_gb11991 [Eleusine coracana subsp. coracana]
MEPDPAGAGAGSGAGGRGFERACRLPNTVHSDVAPALALPKLPPSLGFGSLDDDEPLAEPDRPDMIMQAADIARILADTDISHLGFTDADSVDVDPSQCSWLWREVLKHNPNAFKVKRAPAPAPAPSQGPLEHPVHQNQEREKHFEHLAPSLNKERKESVFPSDVIDSHREHFRNELTPDSVASKKPKVRKKGTGNSASSSGPNIPNSQELIVNFCETVENFCGRAEVPDDADGGDWLSIPLNDVKTLVNEIQSIQSKNILHKVPVDTITRLLQVIDHQIRCSQGLSIDAKENPDAADAEPLVFSALESIHAALAIMTHHDMPKQLYQEELIERILDFSRHQITDCMAASNPTFRAFYKPSENVVNDGGDDEEDMENGPVSKKRRTASNLNMRKSSSNRYLIFLNHLLHIDFEEFAHLPFNSKQFSKNAVRTYHLADEDQKQIQMITALLVHLVQFSAVVPDSLKGTVDWSTITDASVDSSYLKKCHEAVTEACCLFWSNVLQRVTAAKSQDMSEAKAIIDNLVQDLLTILNLPEYPAAASILEVLCVLLLQNAGLKSKDTSVRCFAIDLLGGIASRLKRDSAICSREKLWILQDLTDSDCMGSGNQDNLQHGSVCPLCFCKQQLSVLQSYCQLQIKENGKRTASASKKSVTPDDVPALEIVQQILLSYLQEAGPQDDGNLFTRWFYLCMWYKDDPRCKEKISYYLARLKSKEILRDSGNSLVISKEWAKKICSTLGQKNSFSRGFDKILCLLLASLRENSPVIRAKALRAVSSIVEADPEVLGDKRVQSAVEGRFCDSAISVREAALELVGRHIASHPDVGLKVEEGAANEMEVHALPYIVAMQAFCIVDPTLCIPATDPSQFVVTLQPYLKVQVDSKSAARMLENIIFVIDAVLPLLRKPPQTVVVELEQDLKHMILLGRSLFCLGLLLRYGYQLMLTSENQLDFPKIIDLLKKRYLLRDDFSLKVRALQTLGYILIAKPEFMLQKEISNLIEASLSSGVDHRLKIQGLQNLYEYLRDAESQLTAESTGKSSVQHVTNGGSEVPVAAGAGDTNICGGIIQLYWNSILERCLDINDQVRQSALKIVEVVLRQGLVHPITCVPHLIALEMDLIEGNSKLAHHLLMNMNEKYPSFFESRLGDGLQMSFRFFENTVSNHNMAANMKSNPIAFVKPGISRIYRLIRANRNSRNKFVHSIVRKFESDGWTRCTISFLVYCAEVLASLPFTCPDEPLYLIYDINRVIHLRAGAVESNLKRWVSMDQPQDTMGVPSLSRDSHVVMHEPGGYPEHNLGDVSDRMLNNPCSTSDVDITKLQEDCLDAIALQLLLKLKRHLKFVYSLTDARCQAFSLKELPKSGETLSKQNVPFNIGNNNINLPSCLQDVAPVYQDFKTVLREDTMDFGTYSATVRATVQRKRPTPRSLSRVRRTAPAATVTRVRGGGGGADDDTDDEDWTGGGKSA